MDQEKTFGEILDRKEAFLDYQHIDLQKSQNLHFSEGVSPWFWSKNADFSILCFTAIWSRKKLVEVPEKIKRSISKPQNLQFFKGVSPWFLSKK